MIVIARRASDMVGVIALENGKRQHHSMTNWHTPRFEPLSLDLPAAKALASTALRAGRLSLSFVETESDALEAVIGEARRAGYRVRLRDADESPEVAISGPWDDYFPTISKNMRREFKRRQKRLSAIGEMQFETQDGSSNVDACVREAFAVEAASWKGAAGTAVATEGETMAFYLAVARWAAERGWLRVCFLRLDGRAIASDFALEANGVFYSMKGGYDPAYSEYSPGRLMDGLEIQRAHELGLRRFEFGGDAEHHKLQWRPQFRQLVNVDAFSPTLSGRLQGLVAVEGRAAARSVRDGARRVMRRTGD
jgi:CelD/BcsL family acetyltransferase involved in cellulose biosynthesis